MISSLLLMLAVTPAEQAMRVDCVAAVAIVAFEQARDRPEALAFPPLERDGARFAQIVGEDLVRSGKSKEQAQAQMLAAAQARQKAATGGALDGDDIDRCIGVMKAVAPAPPPPSLAQCAGMLALAARDARRDGVDKDLETFAAVLDSRARDEMRAAGRSGTEIDVLMSTTRSQIEAEAARRASDEVAGDLDAQPCFEMVKP